MHSNSGVLTAQTTGLQRRGSALRTEMLRPIHSTSWRSSMAFVSSASWLRSTNANPRLRPVSRSRGIEHLVTSPYCPNRC